MSEIEAEEIIKNSIDGLLEGEEIVISARKPSNRLEHHAVFAIIFKHDKLLEIEVIKKVKKLATENPSFVFGGSEVNNKFEMDFVAIFVIATIK